MKTVNEDPILDIRKAVLDGMCRCGMEPDKRLIDAVVDSLPDFFRQPLRPATENRKCPDCGGAEFESFNSDLDRCLDCETLVDAE